MKNTIDYYMSFDWHPTLEDQPDGDVRLSFPGLPELVLFSPDRAELEAGWRDALYSHLSGYMAMGKTIPLPFIWVQEQVQTGSQGWAKIADVNEFFPVTEEAKAA